jgi:flagellar hook assembly protein FlgD
MNWAKYADKKGKSANFKSKERVVQPAIKQIKDENGKVVQKAEAEKKQSYIVMIQKRWDAESGKVLPDNEVEYSLEELETEKARCDAAMAMAKEKSDGLALAIEDYKKL